MKTLYGFRLSKLIPLAATALLFASACGQPAVYFDEGGHACTAVRLGSPTGLECLLLGWFPPFTLPWSANAMLLLGAVFLAAGKPRVAGGFGTAAVLLGLSSWMFVGFSAQRLFAGYYLWQASHLVLAVSSFVLVAMGKAPAPEVEVSIAEPVLGSPFAPVRSEERASTNGVGFANDPTECWGREWP